MFLEDLKKIKDNELLTRFSQIVQKEREAIAAVVFYLSEIARRKLYLEEAYSSLFSFVTQKFHYSEGAAYRRIQASKVSQLYPQVLGLLSQGKVSLMTLSLIEPHLTKENAGGWIEKIIGKSKREVEFMLSELSLKKEHYRDVIRRLPVTTVIPSTPAFAGAGSGEESHRKDPSPLAQDDKFDKGRQEKLPAPLKVPGSFSGLPLTSSEPKSAQNFSFTGESGGGEGSSAIVAEPARKTGSAPSLPKEEVRKIKVEFVAKEELAKKIERAKEVLRHKFPEGKFEDIFDQALEDLLEKRDPQRKIERLNKKNVDRDEVVEKLKENKENHFPKEEEKEKELQPAKKERQIVGEGGEKMPSRYIPQQVRRRVWLKDGGRCSYKSPDGRRCGERNFIQIDHLHPFAMGGESTEENLRILCAKHNQWRSEKTFGKWG